MQGQCPLHREVPRFHVRILEVGTDGEHALAQQRSRGRDNAGRGDGNRNRRRETVLERCRLAARKQRGRETVAYVGVVIVGTYRIVVSVSVIRERRITGAEAAADDGLVRDAVGYPDAWRKVVVARLHAQVRGVAADPGYHQVVGSGIVIREAAREFRRGGGIKLPAQAEIDGQFGRHLPFVPAEPEELPLAVSGEIGVDIAADIGRRGEQEAGHVVGNPGRRGGAGGRETGGRTNALGGAQRGLRRGEVIDAARAVRLVLQQVVADALEVDAPLEGVVALHLGPDVDHVHVGFAADPGQAGRVTDHRIGKAVVDVDAHHAARELVDVHAGNTDRGRVVAAVIGRIRLVVIVRNRNARLHHEAGG